MSPNTPHPVRRALGAAILAAAAAGAFAGSATAAASPAEPLGYKMICGQAWKSTPVGGAVPDRPKYTIERTRCVGVQDKPSYLDKPRNEVRIQPSRELPKPGNLDNLTPANPIKVRRTFIRRK